MKKYKFDLFDELRKWFNKNFSLSLNGKFKEIYRNTLELNESVSIPFELLIKAFKTLYPYNDLMVNFSLRP